MVTVRSSSEQQEQRLLLYNVEWDTYECLLRNYENSSTPKFTYDHGVLEIMSPLTKHESYKRAIESVVDILVLERGINIDGRFGSTTFKREDLQRGFEPDSSFYVQHEPQVRGKDRIDLSVDPPPDLVVEIDITHSSLDKLPIYAEIGVPEIWRYDGNALRILVLDQGHYVESPASVAVPVIKADALSGLLRDSEGLDYATWLQRARDWVRNLPI